MRIVRLGWTGAGLLAIASASVALAATWNTGQTLQGTTAVPLLGPDWSVVQRSGTNCTGPATAMSVPTTVMGPGWKGFRGTSAMPGMPIAANGVSNLPVTKGSGSLMVTTPADHVMLHPGPEACPAVRFTAPTAGSYGFYGRFFDAHGSGATSIHDGVQPYIVRGASVVGPTLGTTQSGPQSFAYTVSLNPGDTIDFAVNMRQNPATDETNLRINVDGPDSAEFKATDFDFEGGHGCAIEQGSGMRLWCWGLDSSKQLGRAPNGNSAVAVLAGLINPMTGPVGQIEVGAEHSCARGAATGRVVCFGRNNLLQTGATSGGSQANYDITPQLGTFIKFRTETNTGCVIRSGGAVECWGQNGGGGSTGGLLGHKNGSWTSSAALQPAVPVASGATDVSTGAFSCAVVGPQGKVLCWGNTAWGAGVLGDGSPPAAPSLYPNADMHMGYVTTAPGTPLTGVRKVEVRSGRACALKASGTLFCWGINGTYGWLLGAPYPSAPNALFRATAMPGPFATGVSDFAMAGDPSGGSVCAVAGAGAQVFCQGNNKWGQLGKTPVGAGYWRSFNSAYGTNPNVTVDLTPIPGLANVVKIRGGGQGYCVLRSTNEIWCWGGDANGSLGNGAPLADSAVPVRVTK